VACACRARLTAARALTARPPVRASSMATARKIRLSVRAGGGLGLVGLRERAALAGGSFEAGPQAGNWQVTLRIPA
jgi:hypothetical protein